jgi:signal transduction histidine kinase
MTLGQAQEELSGDAAGADLDRTRALVDAAHRDAKTALVELRDLARGIHPPVLDSGLGPALESLAARSAVPVSLHVDLPSRPSPAIETIAYYCAAELITNAVKHSGAPYVGVTLTRRGDRLRLQVDDDGRGGARIVPGGGLAGLVERTHNVDGRLAVLSPEGGPTVITAELPHQL